MPEHPYAILDVFTDVPLEGNPVAVFSAAKAIPEAQLQPLARELNLSETVFVYPPADPASEDARVRIFTPALELPFAGHPVLGTAVFLGRRDGLERVRLRCDAGLVPVELTPGPSAGGPGFGEMSQPLPAWEPFPEPQALLGALGVPGSELPIDLYDNGPRHTYVALTDAAAVTAVSPDLARLERLGAYGVSCFALDGTSVRTRMFGPALGVAEDPATGSAAGPLAVHLARHGRISFGQAITITQGVEIGRPSQLLACAHGSPDALQRVTVAGAAVQVASGHFSTPG